jgi:plasmid stability protein
MMLTVTITVKNIPRGVHALLKKSAAKNRRSLNSEILARLEREVSAPRIDRTKLARELRQFTEQLPRVDHRIGDRYKRKGLK